MTTSIFLLSIVCLCSSLMELKILFLLVIFFLKQDHLEEVAWWFKESSYLFQFQNIDAGLSNSAPDPSGSTQKSETECYIFERICLKLLYKFGQILLLRYPVTIIESQNNCLRAIYSVLPLGTRANGKRSNGYSF